MRSALRTLLALVFAAASVAPLRADEPPPDLGTRKAGVDWPDFLGPQRNGRSPETGLPAEWTGGKPRVMWQCPLGESYGAPSIDRGRLFHVDRLGNVHRLTCRNSETGAVLWITEFPADYVDMLGYNNGPRTTPVVDGDRVYVASPEGRLHCVRAIDGGRLWNVDSIKQFGVVKNFFGVGSTPIVWGDLLIANIGGSPAGSPTDVYAAGGRVLGNGTGVVALDKRTGEVRWQATDELASYASPVIADLRVARPKSAQGVEAAPNGSQPRPSQTPSVPPEQCLFVFARGGLVALDPASGKVRFQFPWRSTKLESVNASSPVTVGDEVFISESYGPGSALLRVTPAGHEIVWQDDPKSRDHALELHWNTAVHHDGYLYASSGQHSGAAELRCVAWKTGEVMWREPGLGRSSLLYVDGRLVCLSEEGSLRLLRATPERYEVLADLTPVVDESLRDSTLAPADELSARRGEPKVADNLPAVGEPLLDSPAWAAPVLSHGLLYVRGGSRLVCLELIPAGGAD